MSTLLEKPIRINRTVPDKGLGAINWVNEPQVFGIVLRSSGFFAIETVRGKALENDAPDRLLAFDISLGNRRHVRLGAYREVTGVVGTADVRSGFRSVERGAQKL